MKIASVLMLNVILPVLIFSGFIKPEPIRSTIEGIWVLDKYEDSTAIYKKVKKFEKDKPGFEFKPNGILIKRQNIGWCGTPPISYGNFNGKWEWKEDNTIWLEYEYWGGVDTIGFKVETVNNLQLKGQFVRF